jgi:chromosome segregation ATPase
LRRTWNPSADYCLDLTLLHDKYCSENFKYHSEIGDSGGRVNLDEELSKKIRNSFLLVRNDLVSLKHRIDTEISRVNARVKGIESKDFSELHDKIGLLNFEISQMKEEQGTISRSFEVTKKRFHELAGDSSDLHAAVKELSSSILDRVMKLERIIGTGEEETSLTRELREILNSKLEIEKSLAEGIKELDEKVDAIESRIAEIDEATVEVESDPQDLVSKKDMQKALKRESKKIEGLKSSIHDLKKNKTKDKRIESRLVDLTDQVVVMDEVVKKSQSQISQLQKAIQRIEKRQEWMHKKQKKS